MLFLFADVSGSAATNELDCGSDRRAVYASFLEPSAGASKMKKKSSMKWVGSPTYETELETLLDDVENLSWRELQDTVKAAAH
eukprot:8536251-Pyramimonas_sp.AAC.1